MNNAIPTVTRAAFPVRRKAKGCVPTHNRDVFVRGDGDRELSLVDVQQCLWTDHFGHLRHQKRAHVLELRETVEQTVGVDRHKIQNLVIYNQRHFDFLTF